VLRRFDLLWIGRKDLPSVVTHECVCHGGGLVVWGLAAQGSLAHALKPECVQSALIGVPLLCLRTYPRHGLLSLSSALLFVKKASLSHSAFSPITFSAITGIKKPLLIIRRGRTARRHQSKAQMCLVTRPSTGTPGAPAGRHTRVRETSCQSTGQRTVRAPWRWWKPGQNRHARNGLPSRR